MHSQYCKLNASLIGASVVLWSLLSLVLAYTAPNQHGIWDLSIFYVLLLCALATSVTSVEVVLRKRYKIGSSEDLIKVSVRQATFIALLVVLLLALQSQGLLFWWVGLSVALLFICIEALFNL